MNVLKALAKMTKIASRLQDNWDHSLRELATLEEKYNDTVKVAAERDTRIKQLDAELYAAQQNVTSVKHLQAVAGMEAMGYGFSAGSGWTLPAVAAAPVAQTDNTEQTPYPAEPRGIGWRNNSSAAAPRDMTESVEVVLLNGTREIGAAATFEWGQDLSVGVAWWRFERRDKVAVGATE